jgi:serine protease SohB
MSFLPPPFSKKGVTVPVLRLYGVIGMGGRLRQGLSIAALAPLLEKAFSIKGPAVALLVNSPGGSPVQSDLIFQRIRSLAVEKKKRVHVFAEDLAASGGYMLACAGDEIYAAESSIVGSIGVVSGGFGFPELLKKIGVERRLYTAGENKARLDPFRPEDPSDIERLMAIQTEVHAFFKALVKDRRQGRLKGDEPALFSGDIWLGREALALGLIDGIGEVRGVMRRLYGEKVKLKVVEGKSGWIGRRLKMEKSGMAVLPEALMDEIEARSLWGRYGL